VLRLILIGAAGFTLLSLLPCVLWLAWRRRGGWRRLFLWHAALAVLHLFGSVPVALAFAGRAMVRTRGDERAYAGPRIAADGSWLLQSRVTLAAEATERAETAENSGAAEGSPFAVSMRSSDGTALRGFLVPPASGAPKFSAVLVHGLFRGALELEPVGAMLRELGGEVLLLEQRCHGGSGRATFTYGRDETEDVLAATDWLRARPEGARRPLLLFAVSIGTAPAALAAPRIEGLSALVLDAPIDELRATTERTLGVVEGRRGVVPQPWRALFLLAAEWCGTMPFHEVVPIRAMATLPPEVPVLLIGGGADTQMPPAALERCFAALPTRADRKQLWIHPTAAHGRVWSTDPAGYRERLAWLISHLR
jgi:alpha-beta hydrolase superfamily lysophospholipase